jgi:hypothetical protein
MPAPKSNTEEQMNTCMTKISLDEQRDICGGDWYDSAASWLESLALVIGML